MCSNAKVTESSARIVKKVEKRLGFGSFNSKNIRLGVGNVQVPLNELR